MPSTNFRKLQKYKNYKILLDIPWHIIYSYIPHLDDWYIYYFEITTHP